jgi:hypothetical protein
MEITDSKVAAFADHEAPDNAVKQLTEAGCLPKDSVGHYLYMIKSTASW